MAQARYLSPHALIRAALVPAA